jgi:hypothetical protein
MPLLLTPGLTPFQAARLRDDLVRLTALPEAIVAPLYMDADRYAGRYMLKHAADGHATASDIADDLLREHRQVSAALVGYIAGLAHGIRRGRTFAPPPRARSKWISDEYKRLSEPNRRTVQKHIRALLKAQTPIRQPAPSAAAELAAAKRWTERFGRAARRQAAGL